MTKEAASANPSVPLHEVLEAEFALLHGKLPPDYPSSSEPETRLKALRAAIHALKEKRAALCISGGGIRSATFGLGILQGLARCGLLEKFHYLSTVSGGSYIGAWLSTWIKRDGTRSVMVQLSRPPYVPPFEPQAVRNLRNHSTYLTEKSGPFGGASTWLVAYLWQLMAFWLMLGLSAAAVLLLPRLWFTLLSWHPTNAGNYSALICAACAAVAILYVISDLPGLGNQRRSQGRFVTLFLIPLFGFAYAFTTWRIWVPPESTRSMVDVGGASAAVASLSLLLGMICFIRPRFQVRKPYWKYVWKWLLFAIPLSAITGALSSYLVTAVAVRSPTSAILFAPPLLGLMVFITAIVFPAVLASARSDDQEWMNIAGSAVFLSALLLTFATWMNTMGVGLRPVSPRQDVLQWVCLVILILVLSRVINVNSISEQASYRNRLVRAYLGASNPNRHPHPLTGMDANDDVEMAYLTNQGPFHVVNMALNISRGITRKRESFIMTPLHCGSALLGFRPTAKYAGGVSLGTAVGISGAAVEPGAVGGRSRFRRAALMLFNARLGVWLGNPGPTGRFTWRRTRPRFAISSLMKEMFGLATENGRYVRLSDGGHFENLGLYEMVLRRCHFIVVSDASQDPECFFADLGEAVRKIRIDFGIPIDFGPMTIYPRSAIDTLRTGHNCAIGRIRYSLVDGPDAPDGILVYIKPACYGEEPRDIVQYFKCNPLFPHESTTNQFFSESQFESYRMLGEYTMEKLCKFYDVDFRRFIADILKDHLKMELSDLAGGVNSNPSPDATGVTGFT